MALTGYSNGTPGFFNVIYLQEEFERHLLRVCLALSSLPPPAPSSGRPGLGTPSTDSALASWSEHAS